MTIMVLLAFSLAALGFWIAWVVSCSILSSVVCLIPLCRLLSVLQLGWLWLGSIAWVVLLHPLVLPVERKMGPLCRLLSVLQLGWLWLGSTLC